MTGEFTALRWWPMLTLFPLMRLAAKPAQTLRALAMEPLFLAGILMLIYLRFFGRVPFEDDNHLGLWPGLVLVAAAGLTA